MALILTVAGYIFGRVGSKNGTVFVNLLNKVLFYVIIPIVIFRAVYGAEDLERFSSAIVVSGAHIASMLAVSYVASYVAGIRDKNEMLAFSISIAMPNSGYLAIPLALILLGSSRYVVPYTIAFNIALPILIVVLSVFCRSSMSGDGNKVSLAKSIPFISSLAVSLLLRLLNVDVAIPHVLFNFIEVFILMSFMIIGYEFSKITATTVKTNLKFVLMGIILRYVISPTILILTFRSNLINGSEYYRGLILQSVMPPAISNIILAKVYNLKPETVSLLTVVMTPVSIVVAVATSYVFVYPAV